MRVGIPQQGLGAQDLVLCDQVPAAMVIPSRMSRGYLYSCILWQNQNPSFQMGHFPQSGQWRFRTENLLGLTEDAGLTVVQHRLLLQSRHEHFVV